MSRINRTNLDSALEVENSDTLKRVEQWVMMATSPVQEDGPITLIQNARGWLDHHKVPQMMESLVASLMLERPEDHLGYLDNKLEVIKETGVENVNWETFIKHLHPLNDPVRKELVQDGKSQPPKREEPDDHIDTGDYEPDVFQLTESHQ